MRSINSDVNYLRLTPFVFLNGLLRQNAPRRRRGKRDGYEAEKTGRGAYEKSIADRIRQIGWDCSRVDGGSKK